MTVDKWNKIIDTYRKYVQASSEQTGGRYDGVIFAHGTDTLAYSAALFSLVLGNTDVPVFFVSSNARLDSGRANGNDNFRCAVECICRGITPNVYVSYKNISDGKMYLHLASRLQQCENYSEDFYSVGAMDVTAIDEDNYKEFFRVLEGQYPSTSRKSLVDVHGDWKLSDCVLMIKPYVGLNYDAFDYKQFKAVLHGTFHSGTACAEQTETACAAGQTEIVCAADQTEIVCAGQTDAEPEFSYGKNSILRMIDICASLSDAGKSVDIYYSPSKLAGEVYDTVRIIGEHKVNGKGVNFLYGYTNEMAYAKILLAYSVFDSADDRKRFIETECCFEVID